MALLAPGNDTRVNLHLLLLDRHPDGTEAAAITIGGAAPFSWAAFEDVLSGRPAESRDEVSEEIAPQASEFATGEGTRCVSNSAGAAGLEAALVASPRLPPQDRVRLSEARKAMQPSCGDGGAVLPAVTDAIRPVRSPAGRAFAAYLVGAAAFYDGDFDTANARFADLRQADADWLRQSARYMLGRVEINRAQSNAFDEYGVLAEPSKVDTRALAAAETDLQAYLRDYPAGLYAASARGLLRRVYWLGGNRAKLIAEYAWQFAQTDPHARNLSDGDLAQEVDAKLLDKPDPAGVGDLTLLAVIDLLHMRHDGEKNVASTLSLADLQAQRPRFATDPALFDYLLAAHAYFIDGRPAEVVRLIAAEPVGARLSYLRFSGQLLRALALDRVGDATAREALTRLIPAATRPYQRGALELALAMYDERHGAAERVFDAGSPIQDTDVRGILLRHAAGPILLRQQATAARSVGDEAQWALFILLYKELTRGKYADFVGDLKLLPAGAVAGDRSGESSAAPPLALFAWSNPSGDIPCPSLREMAMRLARDPHAVGPRLCLGEFTRLSGLDQSELDTPPPADELGGQPSRFPGAAFSRMTIYQSIIADTTAPAEARAYALYRAINCYAPSRNNVCGGPDLPPAQRKTWFRMLKSQFATSPWSAALKYYW
jgi:TolA-binding protein